MIAFKPKDPGRQDATDASPWAGDVFVFPATLSQQGFWYLDQVQPGNPAYNIAVRFRLQGPLRVEELERALNEIVRRHESLRTVFAVVDGVPVQVVAPRLSIPLRRDDLRGGPQDDRRERARVVASEEARDRFDLAKGPLIRVRLLRLDDEEHTLLVTIHHVVSDGWSIGVLTRELGALYDAYCRGLDSPLPELALQCGDFAVWQEQWLKGQDLNDQIHYWSRQLAHLGSLEIPTDRPRPPAQSCGGNIESILLPRALTDGLELLSHREKATPFMLMLAAFQLLLQRLSGQNDVFVGTVLAGRSRVELEPLIGLFINPVVLRGDLSGDPLFLELLTRVRETVLQAFAHQDVPFERVVDAVQPRRDPSRHPLFQINFLYQRDFVRPFQTSEVTLTAIPSVSPGAIYDLNFFLVERAEGWRASCEYNTDLYDRSTIRRLLGQYQTLLEGVADDAGRRISEIPLEPAKERGLPATPADRATGATVQVLLPPEADRVSYVAPRDPVEARLAQLWEQVLGVQGISVDADFFDVGGHSLLAARLLAQVGKVFRKNLSLASLLQSPTIEAMAARLRMPRSRRPAGGASASLADGASRLEGDWDDPAEQVFAMRRVGSRPPLVIVDAGPFHRPLIRRLGSDQPVFGVALPELSALPEGFTVQDVAGNLVDALCASQVEAPYHLAGWSHAGLIAYEMARQLRSRGKEIAQLILFDANSPAYLRRFQGWKNCPIRLYFLLEKWLYYLRKTRGAPLGRAWRHFRERTQRFQLRARGRQPRPENRSPEDEAEQPLTLSWRMQYLAAANYEPEPCDWPIVLFRSAALQTGWFRDPQLGWGKLAGGGLRVYEMAGEHDAMFLEPDVQRFASILTECLQGSRTADALPPLATALAP